MISHAKAHDYRVHGVYASVGVVQFTTDVPTPAPIIIPAGTKLRTAQDIEFLTLSEVVIPTSGTKVEANVKQWTFVPEYTFGQSDGSINQELELEANVVDKSITVTVAGNQIFTAVDTFAFSVVEDKIYVPNLNTDKNMVIKFGDDITGEIPQSSADIDLSYYTSLGFDGNTGNNSIVEIVDSISLPPSVTLSVINEDATNGGSDVESLEELRVNIPLSIRTKMRAVTDQDYIDIAVLAPGVAKADVSYNSTTGVSVYVVPVGGGIASSTLLEQVEEFFGDKASIQTIIVAKSVGEVRLVLNVIVNVQSGYNQADTVNLAKDNLLVFLSWENADIKGRLVIGDLYQILENTEGVLNSQILDTDIIPYPSPTDPETVQLNWTVTIKDTGTVINTYRIQFTSSTNYNLYKNNDFIANYAINDLISRPDIDFTVLTDSYKINDEYTFKTYPKPDLNSGVIQLDEFSIIISQNEDITIEGTGGVV